MIVVSDASPLNYLVLIDSIEVLPSLFDIVLMPTQVRFELQRVKTPRKVQDWVAAPPEWLVERSVSLSEVGQANLHWGEAASITLAVNENLPLLIDERIGRRYAERFGVTTVGTLGVIVQAHRNGLLDFEEAIQKLRETSYRASEAVYARARERLTE